MDAIAVIFAAIVPWWLGIALLLALRGKSSVEGDGDGVWILGAGYLAGVFLLTVWMRVLSLAGVKFNVWLVALPLVAIALVLTVLARRRNALAGVGRATFAPPASLSDLARVAWWLLIAWLALRFAMLALEVSLRPLYPWDAWTQWATKARVWYELGYLAPFGRVDAWLAANGTMYFDASPEYPPTMPLLQVWSCLVLGRWDDTLMNWPWWFIGVALALVMYGGLRSLGASALAALVGAFLVASMPLANAHVALAGYADLPMAAYYTAAAFALLRCVRERRSADVAATLAFAAACTQVKNPGWFWAATLVPAFVVARWPRYGVRIAFAGFALALIALVALARFKLRLFNYELNLAYTPAWGDLAESYFLLGNWHILWYGAIALAIIGWRSLLTPALAPLTTIVAGGLLFLFMVFGFTTASYYISDQTTVNRATLHLAPLIGAFMVMTWQAFAVRWAAMHTGVPPASVADNTAT